jgi:two-component system cell cycle sensor histidine kinase/response regulator CckA
MEQSPEPRKRSGLEITSEIFVFEDPERIKKTLNGLFGAFLVGSVSILILSIIVNWGITIRLSLGATIAFAIVILIHQRGYPREASLVALVSIGVVSLAGVVTGDGIHDVAIALLPIIIALGSIVLIRPLFYSLTALILISILTIGILEYQGTITNKFYGLWIPADIAILFLISLAGAVVMRLLTVGLNDSLVRAHNSERNYREIFNTSSDAIFIHDPTNGDILDVNDRTVEIFGFSREEIEATSLEILVTGIQPYTLDNARAKMMKTVTEGPQVFDWMCQRKGGDKIWVEVSLRLTKIGGQERILALVRDINDRKRLEEQLLQAEKLQAVGTLAGGVAHDFNNQLTGIIGWTDLIRDRITDDPDLETATTNILKSAKRASDLTAQLLAFARKGKFESKPLDVHVLIREVTDLLTHTIDKRISIETKLEAESPFTTGDPSQLQNALLNLGVNARDSMPQGGRLVFATRNLDLVKEQELCRRWALEPGPFIEISVTDTGEGMGDETLKSIFEPFFTTKKATKGTGLGLAAVYGTVNSHQGCIDVTSVPGTGSTFRVFLPVGPEPATKAEVAVSSKDQGTGRILVIDDEEILVKTIAAILRKGGYDSVLCTDSQEGIERYRQSPGSFNMVLLDMIMPGMNGPQVFHALKEINPNVAVLVMSGATANNEVQGLVDAGAHGFLAKPFHPKDLLQALAATWPYHSSPGKPA